MKKLILVTLLLLTVTVQAQISRLGKDVQYRTALQAAFGKGETDPFWFSANRYGLTSTAPNSALLRLSLQRQAETDSLRRWRIGYGVDMAGAINGCNDFTLQQLYADFQFRDIRLSVGQKERPLELRHQSLSTGGMTTGINARPLPQVRLELPDFWTIPRTKGWLAVKAHIAYGMYTDNRWQRNFTAGTTNLYTAHSLFHSKAGFLRIGNTSRFPVTLTGGFEMSSQFGGEAWNLQDRPDHGDANFKPHQKLPHGIKAFWHALIPGGNDVTDGDYKNVGGNQLGSWHLRLDYAGKGWSAAVYAEHYFDDHSQLFWQYPWKDMIYGGEIHLPRNPFLSSFVYEHIRTTDQSGPIYHDGTSILPDNIYGIDNYYNHMVYGGWQHAGFGIGNPLLISPVYNENGKIEFRDNRIKAHHIGLEGQPNQEFAYRLLYTYETCWGTYYIPRTNPAHGHFLLTELSYTPKQVKGLHLTAAYGHNSGQLLGKANGFMLTVAYNGFLTQHRKDKK